MNNKNLLRPFDLTQAEAGAAICWSYLEEPAAFVGRTADGCIAIRRADGVIETPGEFSLRMKPLFWKEGKPVYAGDRLWHSLYKRMLVVNRLQEHADAEKFGRFYDTQGFPVCADLCRFKEPPQPLFMLEGKPVNKGDRLWHIRYGKWVTVASDRLLGTDDFLDAEGFSRSPYYCMWDKPKTTITRYANVYYVSSGPPCIGEMYSTVDGPKGAFGAERSLGIARIEWQE